MVDRLDHCHARSRWCHAHRLLCLGSPRTQPILNRRWRLNKEVHFATAIGFFDFLQLLRIVVPAYYWSMIVKDYSLTNASYYSNTQSLALTVFGILAGFNLPWHQELQVDHGLRAAIRILGLVS